MRPAAGGAEQKGHSTQEEQLGSLLTKSRKEHRRASRVSMGLSHTTQVIQEPQTHD